MATFEIALLVNYIIAFMIITYMVVRQNKRPEKIFAWILLLIVFPFGGVFIFIVLGAGIGVKASYLIKKRALKNKEFEFLLKKQATFLLENEDVALKEHNEYRDLILFNLKNSHSIYTDNNQVDFLLSGPEMLECLKADLRNAKSTINIMFYIFANDRTGKEIKQILIDKAKEGVEVKLIYDAIGSIYTNKRDFKELIQAGGKVQEFFPPLLGIKLLNFKANYRNHRKVVVIDGQIGYTGGINIRNDHMGYHRRIRPWRDAHLRIEGGAVDSLQQLFLSDWRYVVSKEEFFDRPEKYINTKFFPSKKDCAGNTFMQIVASGPDSGIDNIRECLIKMLFSAKDRIRIQTPYFIPDETFMDALRIVALSGVKVEVMIPKVADKKFVYLATLWYTRQLASFGVKIYRYNGFLHAKTVIIDDKILSIGSCNIDVRSFKLNFEVTAIMYDKDKTQNYNLVFDNDVNKCELIDERFFDDMNPFKKLMLSICRMFSSLL